MAHCASLTFRIQIRCCKCTRKIGVEDSSTDLALRGMPVFRGLIGPIPEGRNIVRYETPEVFEAITKEWSSTKVSVVAVARFQPASWLMKRTVVKHLPTKQTFVSLRRRCSPRVKRHN